MCAYFYCYCLIGAHRTRFLIPIPQPTTQFFFTLEPFNSVNNSCDYPNDNRDLLTDWMVSRLYFPQKQKHRLMQLAINFWHLMLFFVFSILLSQSFTSSALHTLLYRTCNSASHHFTWTLRICFCFLWGGRQIIASSPFHLCTNTY